MFHTNRQIGAALAALTQQRALTVGYEAFCADTSGFLGALRERLGAACESLGVPFTPSESLAPASFEARDRARAKGAEHEAVPDAWLRLTKV